MTRRIFRLAIAIAVAVAAAGLVYWYTRPSARDLAVERCMNGDDGDMFTWKQLCEGRYDENGNAR